MEGSLVQDGRILDRAPAGFLRAFPGVLAIMTQRFALLAVLIAGFHLFSVGCCGGRLCSIRGTDPGNPLSIRGHGCPGCRNSIRGDAPHEHRATAGEGDHDPPSTIRPPHSWSHPVPTYLVFHPPGPTPADVTSPHHPLDR
ncbi:MAG: hypothetical protein FJ295_07395 [Planctomycetes bacterium]|nr:hypothetical protein [Planctomycetota bacterium]